MYEHASCIHGKQTLHNGGSMHPGDHIGNRPEIVNTETRKGIGVDVDPREETAGLPDRVALHGKPP